MKDSKQQTPPSFLRSHFPRLLGPLLLLFLAILAVPLLLHFVTQQPQQPCNHSGRVKHPDGSYTFAQLHIGPNGILSDEHGCAVYLLGGEGKKASVGGSGTYALSTTAEFSYLDAYLSKVPQMNTMRVGIKPDAWNANVPIGGMPYKEFLKAYVKAIEAKGMYVQLNKNQVQNPHDGARALTEIARIFVNDPAVLFDVRNEGVQSYEADPLADNNLWLDAVQAGNPKAVKVVYENEIGEMMAGTKPFYTQSNLLIDMHMYSGVCKEPNANWQQELSSTKVQMINWLHAHQTGLIINEWGGTCNFDAYTTAITTFVLQNHAAGLNYFHPSNWTGKTNSLGADNAALARKAYSTIFGSPSV